jgi:two-component system, cell cycle sensor histidine kinase and response regulator CckA
MSKKIKRLRNFNAQLRSVNEQLKTEILHRQEAEDNLKAAYHRLSDIIEFLPDATFVIDKDKKVIAWNKAIEEMTGVKKEEIIGKGDYAYSVPFYGKPRPLLVDLLIVPQQEIEVQYSYVKREKDGLYAEVFVPRIYGGKGAFVWAKAAPLFDNYGQIVGVVESIRDITDRKEAEAILRQDKESFEAMNKIKTEQLLLVQKELTDAKHLSEIGSLAATVAHELRNPLAAIRTAAYNIGKKSRNRGLESHLNNIEKKVIECDQTINNLLSYSRVKVSRFEKVRICSILKECIDSAQDRYYKWKVRVVKKCNCAKSDHINADPFQMRELFNNILNNAFESFPEKKGKLVIQVDALINPGSIVISFIDNGIGINPDDLEKLSRPFFTTKSKGTGLGLTICRQLVSLHEGSINFKSEIGRGTEVKVTLPRERKLK